MIEPVVTQADLGRVVKMMAALRGADSPLDVLALVCKSWIERERAPWRRMWVRL